MGSTRRINQTIMIIKKIFTFLTLPRLILLGCTLGMTSIFTLCDPDYYWHLKTGEYIIQTWSIPNQDIFSYTMEGEIWVLHEWLFEIILYAIYSSFGEISIKFLTVSIAFLSIFSIFSISKKHSSSRIAFLAVLFLYPILFVPFIAPRPQIISYIFFTFIIHSLFELKYFYNKTYLYYIPILMIFWVNLHGGYIVGIALLLIFYCTEFLNLWFKTGCFKHAINTTKHLGLITIISIIATGVNPEFYQHLLYPFQVMSMGTSLDFINEWKSPDFHIIFGKGYLIFIFIFFLTELLKNKRSDFTEILLPLFFLMQGFIAVRHIPITLLTITPFLCKNITIITSQENIQELFTKLNHPWLKKSHSTNLSKDLGTKEYLFNWLILCSIILLFYMTPSAPHFQPYQDNKQAKVPEEAVNFIENNHIEGHIFNNYDYGGYLIYRLFPKQKIFIDGRADMYGDEFVEKYISIYYGDANWEKNFDEYNIQYIISGNNAPLRQLVLARGDFKLVYEDEYHSVLLKNNPAFQKLISEHEML